MTLSLTFHALDLTSYHLGQPQCAGLLTMLPIFGPAYPSEIVSPRDGLKLSRVVTYGEIELSNTAESGIAIVPLHIGYIQDAAQNHALCKAAFIGAGQTVGFKDACCVQERQGGYLKQQDQWFFILPVQLRAAALAMRGQNNYSKLWDHISQFNRNLNLPTRGHLEQILTRQRAHLTQFQSRLELMPQQIGALFFFDEHFIGLEIAPNPDYFADIWMPLVCFSYGVTAWAADREQPAPEPFEADSLSALRNTLQHERQLREQKVLNWLNQIPHEPVKIEEEERYLDLRMNTVEGEHLAGQFIIDENRLVYASLFAT